MLNSPTLLYLKLNSLLNGWRSGKFPPREVPTEMEAEFTQDGQVPRLQLYVNDIKTHPLRWTERSLGWNPARVRARKRHYYGATDSFVYSALEKFPIRGRNVVIVGSEMPWYECVCTEYGGRVTTIEYRDVDCRIPGLNVVTPAEFARQPTQFDAALSISSIEHDGLGRYGDPINPRGDLRAMQDMRELLKPDGLLFLAVPVGRDALVWNAHRIYGRQRLPQLLGGWEQVASFGFEEALFDQPAGQYAQPVFVLRRA
ncbi:MAG: DUF268 domain-containing protein [Pirellulales bacterium]